MTKLSKKISMQDIADRLGVSKNAVSLALNGKQGVSEDTRELVIRMAQKLGYAGIASDETKSNKILVIIPGYIRNDSYFYNDIYWSIEMRAKQKGYTAIMTTVSDEMQENNEMPAIYYDMEFLGIILVGILTENYTRFLCNQTQNIVSVDHYYNDIEIDCVVTENIQGSYTMTKYVIAQGHTKIGFIGSIDVTSSIFERWCGYVRAMQNANIPINPEYSITDSSPLTSLLSNTKEILEKLKGLKEFPTAWICGGDRIAITLIEAMKSFDKRVPQDVSIAGFDNIEAATIVHPPLTTINVKRKQLGSVAVDKLVRCADRNHERTKTAIYTSLIVRGSVCQLDTHKL